MISLFSYNKSLSEEENSKKFEPLISNKLNEDLISELNGIAKRWDKVEKKATHPYMGILRNIFFTIPLVVFVSSLLRIINEGFEYTYKAYWIFWIISALILITGIVIEVVFRCKAKKYANSDIITQLKEDTEAFIKKRNFYFNIPSDAKMVDVIIYAYKTKDGETVLDNPQGIVNNLSLLMYKQNSVFCFNDNNFEYSFAYSDVKSFELINDGVRFINWNKNEAYNSKEYLKYNIKKETFCLSVKNYYRLEVEKDGIQYEIDFLPYEGDTIKKIIYK